MNPVMGFLESRNIPCGYPRRAHAANGRDGNAARPAGACHHAAALCLHGAEPDRRGCRWRRRGRAVRSTIRGAADIAAGGTLPADPGEAATLVEQELRDRVRASGKTNLSRAVSELFGAGLLRRYYAGFAVDHANRGGLRHAVYVLLGAARCLLPRKQVRAKLVPPSVTRPAQGELRLR
ncbi:MAG: hypothetical protein ABI668_09895 [Sphingorhabdus sp.]